MVRCPICGNKLNYIYTSCTSKGYCYPVLACPKCRLKLYEHEWRKIGEIISKTIPKNAEIRRINLINENDIIPFSEDYRIYTYANTLNILAIKLDENYLTIHYTT